MPRIRCLVLLLALWFSSSASFASLVEPDDGPYYRLRRDGVLYIYDPNAREVVPQIEAYMKAIRATYAVSFNWKLDEEQDLVLASPKQQIANAFATVMPNLKSVWFPSGSGMLDEMAESSWFMALATHETAHLYQLNAKVPLTETAHSIFGNALEVVLFVWPLSIQPNLFTPTFLLEGNAVLNESRSNIGGRLYSGEVRALVFAQIKEGEIDPNRLINNQFRFPYGENPYFQGGYFEAHLATKYGIDKTNQFYVAQADHYFVPFILNKTFRDHFGASYAQEIREYVRELEPLAKNQQTNTAATLIDQPFIGPFNHDEKKIFFLSGDGVVRPELYSLEKATGRLTHETLDLPLGKVFWEGEKPLVSASKQHDLHHQEYSLYGEGQSFDSNFRGQIVTDQRAGKTVALDATAWLEPRILQNGELYDVGHSSAILDAEGNIYYFRQNGAEKMLYKNRQPVFKYDGFYGKPLEVSSDGSFYFIANTDFGSTLYQYKNNEIFRVLTSDCVVDARQINENEFLVSEVYPNGHKISVATAIRKPSRPANYSYGFQTYHIKPETLEDPEATKKEERSYNSITQMRYSSLDLVTGYGSKLGLSAVADMHFADPLEYQGVDLLFAGSEFRDQAIQATYLFTKFLPKLFVTYEYDRESWQQLNLSRRFAYNQTGLLGIDLPFWKWRHWTGGLNWAALYERKDQKIDLSFPGFVGPDYLDTYGSWSSLTFEYKEMPDPGVGFFPWRSFTLNYQNKLESEPGTWRKRYNTSMVQTKIQQNFHHDFYGTLSGNVAWAENHDIDVDYDLYPLTSEIRIPRLTPNLFYRVKTAGSARFEFTKVFITPLYSPRIPIGVQRLAPFAVVQGIFMDSDGERHGRYPPNTFEWGYGFDAQLLLMHNFPLSLRILTGFDTRTPGYQNQVIGTLSLHEKF